MLFLYLEFFFNLEQYQTTDGHEGHFMTTFNALQQWPQQHYTQGSGVTRVGVTQCGNKGCHPPRPPPQTIQKSLVILGNLGPKYTKKDNGRTIHFGVKAFKN